VDRVYCLFFVFFRVFFFFQAEDGIRDFHVTGVQTCALPISVAWSAATPPRCDRRLSASRAMGKTRDVSPRVAAINPTPQASRSRSEERRVGKECRSRWTA